MTVMRDWLIISVSTLLVLSQPDQDRPVQRDTLVVGILTIESSYRANRGGPASRVPDTIQFWVTGDRSWRVRTYAVDHDIHVHALDPVPNEARTVAEEHIRRNYGDVLAKVVVLSVGKESSSDIATLRTAGLQGSLERSAGGVVFWNPDGGRYHTQSTPR